MPARPAQKKPEEKKKPARLEFNNSGAWKSLGTLDPCDEYQTGEVLDHAEALIKALNAGVDPDALSDLQVRRLPTLRVVMDTPGDSTQTATLMTWNIRDGWRDAITGEPT